MKVAIKNSMLRTVVLHLCENGCTEPQFIEMCKEHFLDFEKGKLSSEEYWKERVKKAFDAELSMIRSLKKSDDEMDHEIAEEMREAFRFAKPTKSSGGTGHRGRPKSLETIEKELAANALKEAIASKLREQRAEAEKIRNASLMTELMPKIERNEFESYTLNPDAFIPEVPWVGEKPVLA